MYKLIKYGTLIISVWLMFISISFAKKSKVEYRNVLEKETIDAIRKVSSLNKPKSVCDASREKKSSSPECDAINEYPRPENVALAFLGGPENKMCSHYFRTYNFNRSDLNFCEKPQSRYNEAHTPLSEEQMAGKGQVSIFKSKGEELKKQQQDVFRLAEKAKHEVAFSCCKKDIACYKSMLGVKVSICEPPDDPNVPDYCSDDATYQVSIGQRVEIFATIQENYSSSKHVNQNDEIKKIKERIDPSFGSFTGKLVTNLARSNGSYPVSGEVVLSPYSGQSNSVASLNHEFNHACDYIKAQQLAINGEEKPKEAYWATERLVASFFNTEDRCKDSTEVKEYFRTLWTNLGESKDLALCLEKNIESTSEPGKPRYCKKLCKGVQLLESFGVAREIASLNEHSLSSIYPAKACFGVLDERHPMHMDVLECLAQYSPSFNKQFKRVFNCGSY